MGEDEAVGVGIGGAMQVAWEECFVWRGVHSHRVLQAEGWCRVIRCCRVTGC